MNLILARLVKAVNVFIIESKGEWTSFLFNKFSFKTLDFEGLIKSHDNVVLLIRTLISCLVNNQLILLCNSSPFQCILSFLH